MNYSLKKFISDHNRSDNSTYKKRFGIIILLICILILSFFASLLLGSTTVKLSDFINSIINNTYNTAAFRIIYYVRLPRAIAALLSGMALSLSGVVIQAVLNNSLAAPNIIGVNAGAGFTALLIIGVFPYSLNMLPVAAIIGALITTLTIYAIAAKTGGSRITITLAGIAVSSILTAGMNTIKTIFPDSLYNANTFLIGGFSGISFSNIGYTWIIILITASVVIFLAKDIDVLMLGEETAKSLGVNVKLLRLVLITAASILAGCAVSFAGLLGFVGLIIPHIVRKLVGTDHRILVPSSMLLGGSFVLVCDLISRCIFAPYELPVGIVLSFIGGPFFLYLILSRKRGSL